MNNIENISEPVISLFYDKDKQGKYFACMIVSGFETEEQAANSLNHIQALFCAEEIGAVKS